MKYKVLPLLLALVASQAMMAAQLDLKVRSRYLNIPVSHRMDRRKLTFASKSHESLAMVVRIADGVEPDYWVFHDVSSLRGQMLHLEYEGSQQALDGIVQADSIIGQSAFYHEALRPQFHFSSRRGWLNDPNGCIYHDGRYHLYYQHNPMEREWENMTWGHASSTDLIHWTEHTPVLHPDRLGTMFSGSAVYDRHNSSGFGSAKHPPLVYAYTADCSDREVQCIAYSLDGGMTLHKYEGNPVIDSHDRWQTHDTRDPRLFWYEPAGHWVMVLNERNGHSIYTSSNLREWTWQSHVNGFWECPDLFELPVDGNPRHTKWVIYGASNTYMIGTFDGKTFTPESGKHRFSSGAIYAAQTFNDVPDGRRIQIGWANIDHRGMPFRGQMLLPTELQLRTTKDGIRLVSRPISEVGQLLHRQLTASDALSEHEANELLKAYGDASGIHLHATLVLSYATSAGLSLNDRNIVDYDMNRNTLGGQFYSPQDPTSLELTVDVYIDRTSVEVFVDDGLYSYSMERRMDAHHEPLRFWGTDIRVKDLQVDRIDSIWN